MAWWNTLLTPLGEALGKVMDPVTEWQKRKTIESQGDIEIQKLIMTARIEAAKQGQQIEADYDTAAQGQMAHSWKDEFLMLVFIMPFICSFFPQTQPYVQKGFLFLKDNTPYWYQAILLGLLAAVFGLRWLVSALINRLSGGGK